MSTRKTIPYTYLIGWSKLDKWYYGVRYAHKCNPKDLWVDYFTSSSLVKEYRLEYGEPDVIEVRRTFKNSTLARKWEDKVHRKMNVVKSSRWLNKCYGNEKFSTKGLVCAIDTKTKEIIHVSTNDERFKTGEIVHWSSGKMAVRDKNNNVFFIDNRDSRIGTEFVSTSFGFAAAYEPYTMECIGRISVDDPRWKTGEVVGAPHFTGKVMTDHGIVNKNDPRLTSGEITHINKNKCPAKCSKTGESLGQVSVHDPRWKTGEITHVCKEEIMARCSTTKNLIGRVPKDDPRWKTGEIESIMKDTVMAKCAKTGSSVGRVPKDDPRWKTGDIVGIRKRLNLSSSPNITEFIIN